MSIFDEKGKDDHICDTYTTWHFGDHAEWIKSIGLRSIPAIIAIDSCPIECHPDAFTLYTFDYHYLQTAAPLWVS